MRWDKKMKKAHIQKTIFIVGYILLIIILIYLYYKIEYILAFENTSILHLDGSKYQKFSYFFYILIFAVVLIFFGSFKNKIINKKYYLRKSFKMIFYYALNALLFFIEVAISGLIVYLLILSKHLTEELNIFYSLVLFLSLIAIIYLQKELN